MSEIAPSKMTPVEHGVEDGIAWAVCEAPSYGAHNGYVLLPEGHPWRELELQMGEDPRDAPGGITFGPEPDGWIGFDTLHYRDVWPNMPDFLGRRTEPDSVFWTVDMVVEHAKALAQQVKAAAA